MGNLISLLADMAAILGVPFFLISYWVNQNAERQRAEYGTFDALDVRYTDFQLMAAQIENVRLDLGDVGLTSPPLLTDEERVRQRNLFLILVGLFERAYLMYKDRRSSMRRNEWEGWATYIERYCRRASFVEAYFMGQTPSLAYDSEFNKEFQEQVMRKIFVRIGVIAPS